MIAKMERTQSEIEAVINRIGAGKENLLKILLELQLSSQSGYLDMETARVVAEALNLSVAKVYEVITFYAMLKAQPQARYVLKICNSTPCYFSKADEISAILEKTLRVTVGEPTYDGLFCYHYIPCVGACEIGPVIKIKDTVFGNLDEQKIQQLLTDLRDGKYKQL